MTRQGKIVNSNIWQLLAEFCNKACGTQKISLFNYTAPLCFRNEFKNFAQGSFMRKLLSDIP